VTRASAQLAGRGDIGCMTAALLIEKFAQLVILEKIHKSMRCASKVLFSQWFL
jgi:hypothetical protein